MIKSGAQRSLKKQWEKKGEGRTEGVCIEKLCRKRKGRKRILKSREEKMVSIEGEDMYRRAGRSGKKRREINVEEQRGKKIRVGNISVEEQREAEGSSGRHRAKQQQWKTGRSR